MKVERQVIKGQEYVFTEYFVQNQKVLISAMVFPQDKTYVFFTSKRPKNEVPNIIALTTYVLIEDFFVDIGFLMAFYNKNGTNPDKVFESLFHLCQKHIIQYGRLVDTDLYAYIDKFIIALYSIMIKFHQTEINQEEGINIWKKMRDETFSAFQDNIFLTKYDFSDPTNPKPSLIKLSETK